MTVMAVTWIDSRENPPRISGVNILSKRETTHLERMSLRLEIHRGPKLQAFFAKLADSGDPLIGKIHIKHVHI